MINQFSRTELLIGSESLINLKKSKVIVFGIGGVGGFAAEVLARSGIGQIDIVDSDVVSLTNINRQIVALHSTIGQKKVDVMKNRILDINPECIVNTFDCFYLPENANLFDFKNYDYVVDCIDTVSAKISLIENAKKSETKIISSMGTGNKLNPQKFEIADISKTSVCPLARVIRRECAKRNLKNVKVLFSTEEPVKIQKKTDSELKGNGIAPGSISFVPSVAGILIAREVILDLIQKKN